MGSWSASRVLRQRYSKNNYVNKTLNKTDDRKIQQNYFGILGKKRLHYNQHLLNTTAIPKIKRSLSNLQTSNEKHETFYFNNNKKSEYYNLN